MGKVKQIEIKNRTYYFNNDIINIEDFNSSLLKIDKNCTKILIFTILDLSQLKKNGDCENIYSVNPFHLIIGKLHQHIECSCVEYKKNKSKYLVFDSTDENKEILKKYRELWMGLKMKLKQ